MNLVMITVYGSAILLLVLWVFLWFVHILALVYGFVVFFILLHNIPPGAGGFDQPYLVHRVLSYKPAEGSSHTCLKI